MSVPWFEGLSLWWLSAAHFSGVEWSLQRSNFAGAPICVHATSARDVAPMAPRITEAVMSRNEEIAVGGLRE